MVSRCFERILIFNDLESAGIGVFFCVDTLCSLEAVREKARKWMEDLMQERPHESFDYKTPLDLLEQL